MLYVYWAENYDLKTTAWREQDLNATDSIQKKIWLGNQMMLFVILLEIFNLLLLFSPFRRVSISFWDVAKGQLVSKCLFGVSNSPKKQTQTI